MTGLLIPDFAFRLHQLPPERQHLARTLTANLNGHLSVLLSLLALLAALLPWPPALLTAAALLGLLTLGVRLARQEAPGFTDTDVHEINAHRNLMLLGGAGAEASAAVFSALDHRPALLFLALGAYLVLLCTTVTLAALLKLLDGTHRRDKTRTTGTDRTRTNPALRTFPDLDA